MQVPMNKSAKILLATALLLVALAAVILYFSSTVFLQLFIAFALAYVLNPFVVFLRSLAAWCRESDFYRGA